MNDKEKILVHQEKNVEALRVLDEILDIIRFKDDPEDTIIDQKLEEIKKILTSQNIMKDKKECNGKYWFTCSRCLGLLVDDLRAILRKEKKS